MWVGSLDLVHVCFNGGLSVSCCCLIPFQLSLSPFFSSLNVCCVEEAFREAGFAVFSNAKNHRMDPTVPLVVPVVNADHLKGVLAQKTRGPGFIVTNANCSTTGLVVALKPLQMAFGLRQVHVTTMQAISGMIRMKDIVACK
jgi:aspartate-semialdehyde dehydrogenase